jgi:hypothetical protein
MPYQDFEAASGLAAALETRAQRVSAPRHDVDRALEPKSALEWKPAAELERVPV